MKNVSVIGAGTMGNGIAHVFAQNDYKVQLIDLDEKALEKALQTINKNLERQILKGTITEEQKITIISHITCQSSLDMGVKNADLVIEAATENPSVKLDIFKSIDKKAPQNCILATNTSSISITKIASVTQRPDKVIGMHFMNPVPVMRLVEVIQGYNTSQATVDAIFEISRNLDKTPTLVRDYPGFVANRILMPMINEAIETLYTHVAGVIEIDTVMKLGMAHPMGPLQLADFIGLDVCLYILEVMYDGFKNPKYAPCPLLINMVTAGKLGVKSGEGFYNYTKGLKEATVAGQFS